MTEEEYDNAESLLAKDMGIVCTPNEDNLTDVIIENIIIFLLQQQYDIVRIIIIIIILIWEHIFGFQTFNGFTQVIDWIVKTYNNPKLFIAENGIYEKPNVDDSLKKIEYHRVSQRHIA